jgi:hypothetical protein
MENSTRLRILLTSTFCRRSAMRYSMDISFQIPATNCSKTFSRINRRCVNFVVERTLTKVNLSLGLIKHNEMKVRRKVDE